MLSKKSTAMLKFITMIKASCTAHIENLYVISKILHLVYNLPFSIIFELRHRR